MSNTNMSNNNTNISHDNYANNNDNTNDRSKSNKLSEAHELSSISGWLREDESAAEAVEAAEEALDIMTCCYLFFYYY